MWRRQPEAKSQEQAQNEPRETSGSSCPHLSDADVDFSNTTQLGTGDSLVTTGLRTAPSKNHC